MILTKNTTKPFPEIPGNRETIPGNENPKISREFPPGNSREASLVIHEGIIYPKTPATTLAFWLHIRKD